MSLIAALAIAATGFHPPLDRDLAYVISEDRTIAGATAHFESALTKSRCATSKYSRALLVEEVSRALCAR